MALNVNFKVSGAGASTFSLDLEPTQTFLEVKCLAMEKVGVEPAQMKIIFKGRILKDTDTVEGVQVTAGSTMHVVKSAPSAGATVATPTTAAPSVPAPPAPASSAPAVPAATVAPGAGADPFASMMGDPTMMQEAMQMMGGGGAAGGLGGMEHMLQNPQAMQQMLQNPMVQQMMQSMFQNPEMLQAMIQNNPMIQQRLQGNPMLQQMLSNPEMLRAMFNPQMMQTAMQMRSMMGNTGAPATVPQSPAPAGNGAPASPMFDPAMLQNMMQAMQGGMGNNLSGLGGLSNPADTTPPEERYAKQVQQLENMGFPDKHSNVQALVQSNGDVNMAINSLIGA
jgi:ubiquilin